jgi:hypothetical protein
MSEERWQKVKTFISEWFEPLGESDGYSEAEIAEAEARLGIRLPEALREWYGFAGKWYTRLEVQNELLPPERLFWEGKYLIFLAEAQGVCAWAIRKQDLGLGNPPVYDEVERVRVAECLTDWLFLSLCNEIEIGAEIELNTDGTPRTPYPDTLLKLVRQHLSQPK